ncbi:hypothetical protein C8T65DRAFT_749027 [Cerioporus squamosus]|nr:hypothetical protein C8T65DRAFT_749027 [Cerioporus squamosus]
MPPGVLVNLDVDILVQDLRCIVCVPRIASNLVILNINRCGIVNMAQRTCSACTADLATEGTQTTWLLGPPQSSRCHRKECDRDSTPDDDNRRAEPGDSSSHDNIEDHIPNDIDSCRPGEQARDGTADDGDGTSEDHDQDHTSDEWDCCDDDDGRPDDEHPVWVYLDHFPSCCGESDAEGVLVRVLAEGERNLTVRRVLPMEALTPLLMPPRIQLTITRSLAHVRAGVHDVGDFWRRLLRADLLRTCTDRQARVLIASVGCLMYFEKLDDSEQTARLWSEFDNALGEVVSFSTSYPLAGCTDRLLLPLLLWATTRCQDALFLPVKCLPFRKSYMPMFIDC